MNNLQGADANGPAEGWALPTACETGGVALRQWRAADAATLLEGHLDCAVRAEIDGPERLDTWDDVAEHVRDRRLAAAKGIGIGVAICRAVDGEMVGSVELQLVDGSTKDALISIFMLAADRRNGYAVPAIRLATDWVLGDLGLDAAWAAVRPNNKASVATFGVAGYRACDGHTLPDGLKLPSDARMLVCDRVNASEPAA